MKRSIFCLLILFGFTILRAQETPPPDETDEGEEEPDLPEEPPEPSEQCGPAVSTFYQCLKDGKKEDIGSDDDEREKIDVEEEAKACLSDAGCAIEKAEEKKENSENLVDFGRRPGRGRRRNKNRRNKKKFNMGNPFFANIFGMTSDSFSDKVEECRGEVMEGVLKEKLTTCVQEKYPGYVFAAPAKDDSSDHFKFAQKRMQRHMERSMKTRNLLEMASSIYDEDVCTSEQRSAAKDCMGKLSEKVFTQKNPIQSLFEMKDRKEKVCSSYKDCTTALGECSKDVSKISSEVCNCVRQMKNDDIREIEDSLYECLKGKAEDEDEAPSLARLGGISDSVMKEMGRALCQRQYMPRDPCGSGYSKRDRKNRKDKSRRNRKNRKNKNKRRGRNFWA